MCEKIFSMTNNFPNFNKENFSNLLLLAVSNSYFLFNACLYKQLDGLAMGNPLAPALANVFLCHLESIIFTSCPSDNRPKFYRRYLDDTFAVFDTEEHADRFCEFINSIHNNISFTMEKQINSKLSFSDLNIENISGSFSSSVF